VAVRGLPAAGARSRLPAAGAAWTRRAALRAAVGAAAAAAAGSALSACGPTVATLSAAAGQTITVVWRPWYGFPQDPNVSQSSLPKIMYELIQGWQQTQRGVDVQVLPDGDAQAAMSTMLAGAGPDVFHDQNLPLYVQKGLVLDLSPYVQRDRVDLSLYTQGQMDYIRAAGAPGLYALPATLLTLAMGVDLGALDALGLAYPAAEGWTYQQWAQLWQSATAKGPGKLQFGGRFDWSGYDGFGGNPAAFYLRGFGGEYVDPADPTVCALNTPASEAALNWCYGLVLQGACAGDASLNVVDQVQIGQLVSGPVGTAGDLYDAARKWGDRKWDLFPMPVWPRGSLTFGSSDFYAIWSETKAPDLAWSLLRYLTVGTDWQTDMMTVGAGPNQKALWSQWKALVLQRAVSLGSKHLDVYVNAVQNDELYVGRPFRFAEQQVAGILARFGQQVRAGAATVADAAASAAAQIDALQQQGAQQEQQAQAALQRLQQMAGQPPSVSGAAAAPALAPGAVTLGGGGSP
jgi:ABC-type glycerol-3-phosphate transport system substrate-binding protein